MEVRAYQHIPFTGAYEQAFELAQSTLVEADEDHRENAACSAALAASGADLETGVLEDHDRSSMRSKALAWLWADLLDQLDRMPWQEEKATKRIERFMSDPALASVRDPEALQALPAKERLAWEELWREVRTVLGESGR